MNLVIFRYCRILQDTKSSVSETAQFLGKWLSVYSYNCTCHTAFWLRGGAPKMEAVCYAATSVATYQIARLRNVHVLFEVLTMFL
jgi:hypothetical protein